MSHLLAMAVASVIITISQPPQLIPCVFPAPPLTKQEDGSYSRPTIIGIPLIACYGKGSEWQEEWTDYPEKDGTFIRRLSEKE